MTVYADVIFLYNFIMDFFVLWINAKVLRMGFAKLRLLLASAIGGIYGTASLVFSLPEPFCVISVSAIMVLCAYRIKNAVCFSKAFEKYQKGTG